MTAEPFGGAVLLIDNSAFQRVPQNASVADAFEAGLRARTLYAHPGLLWEALGSTQNADEYVQLDGDLRAAPFVEFDEEIVERALDAQRQLAARSPLYHRRFSLVDLLTAAAADIVEGIDGVWHYDRDYVLVREHTDLEFEPFWAVPRGSISSSGQSSPRRALKTSLNNAVAALPDAVAEDALRDLLHRTEQRLVAEGVEVPERRTA